MTRISGAGLQSAAIAKQVTPNNYHAMSKSKTLSLLILVIAVALAFLLNPSPEKHRAEIKKAMAERSELAKIFGIGSLTAFASTYHSLGVASYTTVGDKKISFGMFGMIFVSE